ncbi:alkyl hydroperoxide reductase AhpD [Streptomyces purpureus]|uniref:Alkyl hydroperoxide reductase AhpD n=1 Tax=Streptomyces purpureus TaxID=1951 RepID=A0A918H0D1_9ACTN|nr:alkyl hydroperoxide reductase AhpD [Streptomyces purpureus]
MPVNFRQRVMVSTATPRTYEALTALEDSVRWDTALDDRLRLLTALRAVQLARCARTWSAQLEVALALGERPERLRELSAWRTSVLFAPEERAALALTESLTVLETGGVPDELYDEAERLLGTRGVIALVMSIALTNAVARIAVGVRAPGATAETAPSLQAVLR